MNETNSCAYRELACNNDTFLPCIDFHVCLTILAGVEYFSITHN
jgi:hypothetical protein